MEEKSFSSSHVMQVIYTDDAGRLQTAYLQCKVWAVWRGARGQWGSCGKLSPPPRPGWAGVKAE